MPLIPTDKYYNLHRRSYLSEARAIFRRATGQIAVDLPDMSEELARKSHASWLVEEKEIAKLNERIIQRRKRADLFLCQMQGDSVSHALPAWRGEVPVVNTRAPTRSAGPSFLRDSNPVELFKEMEEEKLEERTVAQWKRREDNEERPSDLPEQRKRKRQRREKLDPVPEWVHEDLDLEIHNSIRDEELYGELI